MIVKLDHVSAEQFAKLVEYAGLAKNEFFLRKPTTTNMVVPLSFITFRDIKGPKEESRSYSLSLTFTMLIQETYYRQVEGDEDSFEVAPIPREAIDGIWDILDRFPNSEKDA